MLAPPGTHVTMGGPSKYVGCKPQGCVCASVGAQLKKNRQCRLGNVVPCQLLLLACVFCFLALEAPRVRLVLYFDVKSK